MIGYCVYISSQSLSNKLSEATGCISQLHRIKFNPSRWLVPNPNGFRKVKGSNASPGKDFYLVKEHISQHAQEALRVRCIWDKFKMQSCLVFHVTVEPEQNKVLPEFNPNFTAHSSSQATRYLNYS